MRALDGLKQSDCMHGLSTALEGHAMIGRNQQRPIKKVGKASSEQHLNPKP